MSQAITRHQSPEEREYARYLTEIEAGKRRIAELQADLATFKEELGRFNAEYHARVGVLFVELDRIELQIREYEFLIAQLKQNPEIDREILERETKQLFSQAREQIHEDEEETRYYEREHRAEQQRPELDAESEASLKLLLRDLAKRFHPDLARTEKERIQRGAVMKEINAAFHERDLDQLRTISARHDVDDIAFDRKSIGEKLVWAIREVNRLDERMEAIQKERADLEGSELGKLWSRHSSDEEVLSIMIGKILGEIELARVRRQALLQEYERLLREGDLDQCK